MSEVLGIHHVTAIAGDPQRNLDFYAGVLGLRLVKRTVNFDDPQTYHLYYGDGRGSPGTILTFFPWPGAPRGRHGAGQVSEIAFSVPPRSLDFWRERLRSHGVDVGEPRARGRDADAEQCLAFEDPDGLRLELVAHAVDDRPGWSGVSAIPAEHGIRGFHDVTITVGSATATERILVDTLGLHRLEGVDDLRPLAVEHGGPGREVRLREAPEGTRGTMGVGVVHHLAFATATDAAQLRLQSRAADAGLVPTEVIDRQYFRSVYFFEPAGVLFEIATVRPGFAVDEAPDHLGEALKLPSQLEPHREELERVLPTLTPPDADRLVPVARSTRGSAENAAELGFEHVYVLAVADAAQPERETLLLLHGTGGDEHTLLPLGRALRPRAAVLSPRGRVVEGGAARFFRRLAEGVFDQEDLARRTDELAAFVRRSTMHYGVDGRSMVAVGFSNGASIAASLLLRHPGLLRRAVLLSATLPFEPRALPDLHGTSVFIGAGRQDPVVSSVKTEWLAATLQNAGAAVTVHWVDRGHSITDSEVAAARAWLERRSAHAGAVRAAATATPPPAVSARS